MFGLGQPQGNIDVGQRYPNENLHMAPPENGWDNQGSEVAETCWMAIDDGSGGLRGGMAGMSQGR